MPRYPFGIESLEYRRLLAAPAALNERGAPEVTETDSGNGDGSLSGGAAGDDSVNEDTGTDDETGERGDCGGGRGDHGDRDRTGDTTDSSTDIYVSSFPKFRSFGRVRF